ncbi:unnamed protein product [Rhizoctonia solani]|uniref:F-box domain-containing protein n=1 Tax=Rhizoctonia solani TaxID=456999 RepID=A0A8H3HB34_9AGAM|nr:unnamed protein product [Rhizoctonia solani]
MEMKHVGGWQIGHVHIRDEVHSTHHIEAVDYFAVFKHDLGMARLLSGSPYMVMSGSTLPYELLVDIFGHLSPSHLAQVSSVCHYWRKAAFPRLYHTVYLCLATHLDEFVQRVHTDDAGSALGDQCVFPRLRRFYARGGEDPDWMDFFDNPNGNPLRQFFVRHPQIEDLALGYANESCYYNDIDPAGIAKLFPSLRYFEGPVFLIPPLLQSCLAEQLEELVISDSWLRDEVDLDTKIYGKVLTLPKLLKFGIWADTVNEDILVNMLRIIVKGANQLEEIEIHHDIDKADYVRLASA